MEWDDLSPIAKVVPRVRARISILKRGTAKVMLGISDLIHRDFGEFKTCNIQCGKDEDGVPMVRLTRFDDEDAKFTVKPMVAGGGSIGNVPLVEGLPKIDTESYACEIFKQHGKAANAAKENWELIVKLPLAEFKAEQQRQASGPAKDVGEKRVGGSAAAPAPQPPQPVEKRTDLDARIMDIMESPPMCVGSKFTVDVCRFLKLISGHNATKNPQGEYKLDGKEMSKLAMLNEANRYRVQYKYPAFLLGAIA